MGGGKKKGLGFGNSDDHFELKLNHSLIGMVRVSRGMESAPVVAK